jgi:WhiB family transcriptional regulator, redox-sensing transcriptional regulator
VTTSLPMPMTVTAPARILTALTESPGRGAYELAAALGYDGRRTAAALKQMRDAGLVVALELARPRTGHPARIYFPAPAGTPPRQRQESRAEAEERRRRDRISQQRRRARLAGRPVAPEPLARPRVYLPPPPPAWQMPGEPACSGTDPGLFFGPEIEGPQARAQRVAAAQAVCAACPVRTACLDGALARGERWGIWGGADLETRRHGGTRRVELRQGNETGS